MGDRPASGAGRCSPISGRSVAIVEDLEVGERGIRLGQLLKLIGAVETGGGARDLLDADVVRVNGEIERRRGRQLAAGDVVAVADRQIRLA